MMLSAYPGCVTTPNYRYVLSGGHLGCIYHNNHGCLISANNKDTMLGLLKHLHSQLTDYLPGEKIAIITGFLRFSYSATEIDDFILRLGKECLLGGA